MKRYLIDNRRKATAKIRKSKKRKWWQGTINLKPFLNLNIHRNANVDKIVSLVKESLWRASEKGLLKTPYFANQINIKVDPNDDNKLNINLTGEAARIYQQILNGRDFINGECI